MPCHASQPEDVVAHETSSHGMLSTMMMIVRGSVERCVAHVLRGGAISQLLLSCAQEMLQVCRDLLFVSGFVPADSESR